MSPTTLPRSSSTGFPSGPGRPPCCCSLFGCGVSETLEGNTGRGDRIPATHGVHMFNMYKHCRVQLLQSPRVLIRPVVLGPRVCFSTAARCWIRRRLSVRWATEEGTARVNTSSDPNVDPKDKQAVSQSSDWQETDFVTSSSGRDCSEIVCIVC